METNSYNSHISHEWIVWDWYQWKFAFSSIIITSWTNEWIWKMRRKQKTASAARRTNGIYKTWDNGEYVNMERRLMRMSKRTNRGREQQKKNTTISDIFLRSRKKAAHSCGPAAGRTCIAYLFINCINLLPGVFGSECVCTFFPPHRFMCGGRGRIVRCHWNAGAHCTPVHVMTCAWTPKKK